MLVLQISVFSQSLYSLDDHGFSGSCFSGAVLAQRSSLFWQLFSRGGGGAAFTNSRSRLPEDAQAQLLHFFGQRFSGSCAGAALTNFPAAVFSEAGQAQFPQFFDSCFPEAAQAQLSQFF